MTKIEIDGKTYRVRRTQKAHSACLFCYFCDKQCPRSERFNTPLLCNEYDYDEKFSYFERID